MGNCLASPESPPSTFCSCEERDALEWRIGIQRHRIEQLEMRLRQWERENAGSKSQSGDIDILSGRTALSGIAGRYGQPGVIRDTPQILRDLAVLNFYQREVLDVLACVPERRVPRVRFL